MKETKTSPKQFAEIIKLARQEWADFNRLDKPRILIGAVTCGRAAGALSVRTVIEQELAARKLTADIYEVGCLGMCYAEPLVEIALPGGQRVLYSKVTGEMAKELVNECIAQGKPRPDLALSTCGETRLAGVPHFSELPMINGQVRIVLRNAGLIDPSNIYHYIAQGGYTGLAKAVTMTPEQVIDEVKSSGLRGRGGAGFSTGLKWELARKNPGDIKYVICNADEGDPGAFMDRSVCESDPHTVLEGLTIAAYAIGANYGYLYVRAEYPLAIERLKVAIRQMEEFGLLGKNILGSGFDFTVRIKEGAGAFVCGEETALIASIEGKRGMPMPRPPFPASSGLHKKPTNINNVETYSNIPEILNKGAAWFAQYGTKGSPGTKTFALAGKINFTGLIEVPMGIKLREIIYRIGGGIPDGKKFKAVQTGGPSGGCIPADLLDLAVDFDELRKTGSIMGSGGMIIMDEESCMVDIARYFLEFSHSESCGKCVPCRMGSQHLLRILNDVSEGQATPAVIETLEKISVTIKTGSLCGLGQNLPNPVLSTLRYFKEEFEKHIVQKKCDALVCKGIISTPCQYTCPIHQDVPAYMGYLAREQYQEAIDVIREANPLPGICGRVCPHPCESKCEAGKSGDPISIRALKRFAADYELQQGRKPKQADVKYSERIAIVGSGPAGLSAAYSLVKKGYACTIFEALPVAGGMLAVGIPDYRLPRTILNQEIDYIKQLGVELKTNQALGKDFTIAGLTNQGYKAVLLAMGAHKPYSLDIPGGDNPAVMTGIDFLRRINLGQKVALGGKVAVIGGGNVAIDSSRTALRLGAKEVFILYRRSRAEMPSLPEELHQLEEEGIEVHYLVNPVRAVSEGSKFKGLECVRMELGEPDASGRRRPVAVQGSGFVIECDHVLSAIGYTSDLTCLGSTALKTAKGDTIEAHAETLTTSQAGIFAAGDVVTGPGNVITAIAQGKQAALSIDQYLRGKPVVKEYKTIKPVVYVEPVELSEEEIEKLARPVMPSRPGKTRVREFGEDGVFVEVEQGYTKEMAVLEAKRCLRCDNE